MSGNGEIKGSTNTCNTHRTQRVNIITSCTRSDIQTVLLLRYYIDCISLFTFLRHHVHTYSFSFRRTRAIQAPKDAPRVYIPLCTNFFVRIFRAIERREMHARARYFYARQKLTMEYEFNIIGIFDQDCRKCVCRFSDTPF